MRPRSFKEKKMLKPFVVSGVVFLIVSGLGTLGMGAALSITDKFSSWEPAVRFGVYFGIGAIMMTLPAFLILSFKS